MKDHIGHQSQKSFLVRQSHKCLSCCDNILSECCLLSVGLWVNVDQSNVTYFRWRDGEPNGGMIENGVVMSAYNNHDWIDVGVHITYQFFCETNIGKKLRHRPFSNSGLGLRLRAGPYFSCLSKCQRHLKTSFWPQFHDGYSILHDPKIIDKPQPVLSGFT